MTETVESFIEKFDDTPRLLKQEEVRQQMYLRAIKAIGDSTKRGEHWLHPNPQANGYVYCKIAGRTYTISRLILCCADGKPLDYNINGILQVACHKTPLCQHRNCISPDCLHWDTQEENLKRRDLERNARGYIRELEFVPTVGVD